MSHNCVKVFYNEVRVLYSHINVFKCSINGQLKNERVRICSGCGIPSVLIPSVKILFDHRSNQEKGLNLTGLHYAL